MEKILLPKGEIIYINNQKQVGKKGKPFRLSGVSKVKEKEKWIKKELKSHRIYWFIYLEDKTLFGVEIDYNNNFYKLIKNK